jgi:hypothetical protein
MLQLGAMREKCRIAALGPPQDSAADTMPEAPISYVYVIVLATLFDSTHTDRSGALAGYAEIKPSIASLYTRIAGGSRRIKHAWPLPSYWPGC